MSTPSRCPTCSFALPEGASRCPQCGRVFGEGNRCPHCHAIAAVRPSEDGYACAACGKPRPLTPETTLAPDLASRMRQRLERALGVASITLAVLLAAGTTMILGTSVTPLVVATLVAALGVGLAARLFASASARDRALAEHVRTARREQAKRLLLTSASTAEELAQRLGTSEAEAERLATELASNPRSNVDAFVDEEIGVVRYGRRDRLPAVRVAAPDEEDRELAADEEDRARQKVEREAGAP